VAIELRSRDGVLGSNLVQRPTPISPTVVAFSDLPAGPVSVTVTAFPDAAGSGVPVAKGTFAATVSPNTTTDVPITANSTIARVEVLPASVAMKVGQTLELTGGAFDSLGRIVLSAPASWRWTSADESIARVTTGTDRPTLTGIAPGATTVTVTQTDAQVSAAVDVSVTPRVVSGSVMHDNTSSPVANATVVLTTDAGVAVATTSTDAAGRFRLEGVPLEAVAFTVVPPSNNYHSGTLRYEGRVYVTYYPNQAGTGPCLPGIGGQPHEDCDVGTVYLFPISSPPPPPMGGCPR